MLTSVRSGWCELRPQTNSLNPEPAATDLMPKTPWPLGPGGTIMSSGAAVQMRVRNLPTTESEWCSMSQKKPIPETVQPDAKICAVCGKRSYSLGGVHPQCAVRLAEAPRERQLKAAKKLEAKSNPQGKSLRQSSWNKKKCPKCGLELHVRCRNCTCGYSFFST